MKLLSVFFAAALAIAVVTAGGSTMNSSNSTGTAYSFHYENILGTSLDLKVVAPSKIQAEKADAAVRNEIERQSKILSTWDPESEVSRWTGTHDKPVPVSPDLFRILSLYDQWRLRTNGALDASAETAIRVWKAAAKTNRLPAQKDLAAAVSKMRQSQWNLDAVNRTATHTGDAPLVLASFTKSYIIDHAADAAMTSGASAVVLNIGGDLAVRGALSEPVDIADPRASEENAAPISHVLLHNLAVATSGDYRRGFDIEGKHYSHIIDPRTAQPAGDIISSTVIAPNPADAGAMATAFSILTPGESAKLAASIPGVAYLLVQKDGQQVRSSNWRAFESSMQLVSAQKPSSRPVNSAVSSSAIWDPSMELTINFELAELSGAVKRPFVVAWIEDSDRFQIKTLALWYHEDRFLTEMKAWFRSDRMRVMAEGKEIVRSISGATRAPGKYSLKWNGMDNDGKPVKPGKYTVFLEVVREHGTYQLMKQQMDFSGTPKLVQLPANTEVTAASFDYHKLTGK